MMRHDIGQFAAFSAICICARIYHHVFKKTKKLETKEPSHFDKKSAVIITGCDTGFGNLLSKELVNITNVVVVALCLKAESAEELAKLGIHSIKCDVTNDKDVEQAKDFIEQLLVKENAILSCLVNNAGIANPGDFVFYGDMKPIQEVMDVNFYGQLRVTQSLLPLMLRTSPTFGGRVINMSSVCGASASAGNSAYNASKFAVEAWSDCLRLELSPFNIKVVKVRPGQFSTAIQSTWMDRFIKQYGNATPQVRGLYGGKAYSEKVQEIFTRFNDVKSMAHPSQLVSVLFNLVVEKKLSDLKSHYWVGADACTLWKALHHLPAHVSESMKAMFTMSPVQNEDLLPPSNIISHVTIAVRNIEKSLPFYEAFGFQKWGETQHGQLFLKAGLNNGKWQPRVLLKENPALEYRGKSYDAGMTRLCIYSVHHAKDVDGLKELGLQPMGPTAQDDNAYDTAFMDPDGFVVYLVQLKGLLGKFVRFMLWRKNQQSPSLFHWSINVTSSIKHVMKGFEALGFETFSDQDSTQVMNALLAAFNICTETTEIEHIRMCNLPDDTLCATLMQWNHPKTEKTGSELTNSMTMSVDDVEYVLKVAKDAGFTIKAPETRELPMFGKMRIGTIYVEPGSSPIEVCCFSHKF